MDLENASDFLVPETSKEDIDEDEISTVSPLSVNTTSSLTPKTPCTPSNNNNGHTDCSPATPLSSASSKKRKRLTPREREERDKERAEKRIKFEEEKLRRDEIKRKKEEERLEKLQQKEQERLKREEERLKKEEERLKKDEDKRKKQDEINRRNKEKEDEKKKKQEEEDRKKKEREQKEAERLRKIEEKEREKKREEEKINKQAQKFTSFFQKSPGGNKVPTTSKVTTPVATTTAGTTIKRVSLTRIGDVTQQQMGIPGPSDTKDTSNSSNSNSGDSVPASSSSSSSSSLVETSSIPLFNPMMFQIKTNMALAPLVRRPKMTFEEVENLDRFGFSNNINSGGKANKGQEEMEIDLPEDCSDQPSPTKMSKEEEGQQVTYLVELKGNKIGRFGRKCGRTELPDNDPEIQVISNKIIENPSAQGLVKWRYKLLQFHDNQRPAYWGTWKKQSQAVRPRKFLGQEEDIDYEFDSDDEWEEEPEDAEDLACSDKESEDPADKEEEEEDDEDGWLVPHGYISDDEGAQDEHLDKEALKLQEKNYFEGLNKQMKVHLPEIQTERLSEFKIVFSPLMKKWKGMSAALQTISVQPTSSVGVGLAN